MFEGLRNRFFRQNRDAALPAQEEQQGSASAWSADSSRAPAPVAEPSQAEAATAVAQPPAGQQGPERAADPVPEGQQAAAPGPQPLPHRPGQTASRPGGIGRDAVITIDNRRYHLANLPEDVRQLVAALQAADRVIAHRRNLRSLLLASRQLLTSQLQQGLQAHASLPPESH